MRWGKRIGLIILWLFEIIFLMLPYELDVLYNTRLGFMRQILFMNENYPFYLIHGLVGLLLILTVVALAVLHFRYRRHKRLLSILNAVWLVLLAAGMVAFVMVRQTAMPLYFYDLTCFCLAIILQLLVIVVSREKQEGVK
ncbi:hypothetical protein ACFQ5M_10010 [Agrilactobacillus yilanensis]|uniref:Uncharacterized protein n=1 Tax=Agrilactobacillus yilanensis TaxID=2485997 RepID=A0ABW4J945_9LACO|nr:hypothetical protein [Agrilactobacillus yilanensis]